jgi:chromosomal replication initiator protein
MVSRFSDDGTLHSEKDPATVLFAELRARVTPQDYETWLEGTPCRFCPPARFVFTAQNRFRRAWMEKNFRDVVRASARAVFELEAEIEFEVNDRPGLENPLDGLPTNSNPGANIASHVRPDVEAGPSFAPVGLAVPKMRPTARGSLRPIAKSDLNPEFSFDSFVVGQSNSVAQAAAIAVCDDPAGCYNPLFIYGHPGTGKTHLLHAICHRLLESRRLRITYLSSEEFLNEFVESLADSKRGSFHSKCMDTDVLVLDDVHFLSGKERTQDELFKVFNVFLEEGKQVILASRNFPRDIPGLQGRLASRFQSGLLTPLDTPNYELRVAILLRKARIRRLDLSMEAAELIAHQAPENTRELEGAFARVVSEAAIRNCPLDLESTRLALRDLPRSESGLRTIGIPQILRAVQEYYQIKARDLLSRCKARSLVLPRHVGMYLARQLTQLSLAEIGVSFGGRDHTTVIYAQERIQLLMESDPKVREDVQVLRDRLSSPRAY